jgi:misacylated tRNA(Ala) deacylase
MGTILLFRDDAYARSTSAEVAGLDEAGRVILDRTVFYAMGGGQPGDSGTLVDGTGRTLPVTTAVYGPDKTTVLHVLADGAQPPATGETVTAAIDWDVRHARMRIHTALHLLTSVLPYPVTGGSIGDGEGRLDFDIPDAGLDTDEITTKLNELIGRNAAVGDRWITDEELDANPGLVKTMSVQPPRGSGRVRLVEIEGIDLQPCGGTHVRNTGEIGTVLITGIEKKGKQNRRVRIALA